MSLPERCRNHAPVPWAEMSEREVMGRRRLLGLLIHMEGREARAAEDAGQTLALAAHRVRLGDLRARWQEMAP